MTVTLVGITKVSMPSQYPKASIPMICTEVDIYTPSLKLLPAIK